MNVLSGAWWSRPKAGVASGVLGLLLGLSACAGAETEPTKTSDAEVQQLVDAELGDRTAELEQEADDAREAAEDAEQALADAEAQAEEDRDRAVAAALAAERAKEPAPEPEPAPQPKPKRTPKPQPLADTGDPLFDTCGAANDNGYGNYVRGSDSEYGHYDDRDRDGIVCEF